jgi:hypothetical protein
MLQSGFLHVTLGTRSREGVVKRVELRGGGLGCGLRLILVLLNLLG